MAFDNISNYFERLVFDEIKEKSATIEQESETDLLADIACVALNQLPARYVRHNVDMVFYMTMEEREHNQIVVENAVDMAIDYVQQHRHHSRPETINQ